jgi:hypothetical protein
VALPQTNADLLKVTRGGGRAEPGADVPAGAGETVFEGLVRVYYQEKQERITTGEGRDVLTRRILIVDSGDPAIDWRVDDTVEFHCDGDDDPITAAVQNDVSRKLATVAGSGVETSRVELAPE